DTQLSRLGGPNFTQLPINRPHVPVNDNHRDGMHQTAVHTGLAPYFPNTIDTGAPQVSTDTEGGYVTLPTVTTGEKVRANPVSFEDHYTQATMFWLSMSEIEQAHIAEAYAFELGKCFETPIRERVLVCLNQIHPDLAAQVAAPLGMPVPEPVPVADVEPSPALSQLVTAPGPITGRIVGVLAAPGADLGGLARLRKALAAQGAVLRVVAPVGGTLGSGKSAEIIERTLLTTRSIEYDAVLLADGTGALVDPRLTVLLQEAFRHCKVIGAWGDGQQALAAAGIDPTAPGVLVATAVDAAYGKDLIAALGLHRAWERVAPLLPPG
ncbi:MAG: catalase, partial [Frankiales bacterium]|nr:catalase [Frankiales bacterium]